MPAFIRRKLGWFSPTTFRYGEPVRFGLRRASYLLTSPLDIQYVKGTNAGNYVKSRQLSSEEGCRRVGRGILTATGPEHHERRRLLWPFFKKERLATDYFDLVRKLGCIACDKWAGRPEVEAHSAANDLTASIILEVLFGPAADEELLLPTIKAKHAFNDYLHTTRLPRPELWPFHVVKSYRRSLPVLDQAILASITKARQQSEASSDLTYLFSSLNHDGQGLTDREVRDELFPLTTTGYETTGDGLAWIFYLLAENAEYQERLFLEIQETLEGQGPSVEGLRALQLCEWVVSEALRLYPPTWAYVRIALANDHLPSGRSISTGTQLFLCPYLMHRHPHYFPNPEAFIPERFQDPRERRKWSSVYFPFGLGAHRCLGENLAALELLLLLVVVVQQYKIQRVCEGKVKLRAGLTLRPRKPIRLKFLPR